MTTDKPLTGFRDFVKEILVIHPPPCFILLYIDSDFQCHVKAASSSLKYLNFTLDEAAQDKQQQNETLSESADYLG